MLEIYKSIVSKSRVLAFVWRVAPGVWPVEFVSDNVEDVLGYTADDLMSGCVSWREITHPDDVPRLEAEVAAYLKEGRSEWSQEYRLITKSGQIRWFADQNSVLRGPGGQVTHIQSIVLDITERKRVEEELTQYRDQLRRLASQLSMAEERERRRVAEQLHDEVSQFLGALSLHLQVLEGASLSPPQMAALSQSRDLLREMSQAVRTLTFELCPPILYESGLAPALAWLVGQFDRKSEARFDFEAKEDIPPLPEDIRAFAFRAARELLYNAAKHANARYVKVSMAREGDVLRISIADDGIGFDPTSIGALEQESEGFGLFSIRERARSLGGSLEIDAAPGRGSREHLRLPM